MAKIILNNDEFDFLGYNRNIYLNGEDIVSTGYISSISGDNLDSKLNILMQETIESIIIKKDNDIIYSINNLNAKIVSIDESYNGDDAINTNLNLQFN